MSGGRRNPDIAPNIVMDNAQQAMLFGVEMSDGNACVGIPGDLGKEGFGLAT